MMDEPTTPLPELPSAEQVHPEKEEIIRQVEYYFGDENLPRDAHLLALAGGDGNGKVELSKILQFPKMRRYKPKLQVKAALHQSEFLEVIENKYIRRRQPLIRPLEVEPRLSIRSSKKPVVPEDKPWLTKGMLKPTGFERSHVEGPLTPAEFTIEMELYASDKTFICRIEEAVNRFCRNRKMHQTTRKIFVSFMRFGGMDTGPGQFGSTVTKKQLKQQGCDAEEIERLTAYFGVSAAVIDSFVEDEPSNGGWYVDFAELAKGFLSSHFINNFAYLDPDLVATACNVLRNFYNYLLYHNVCPEYHQQLLDARNICDVAEDELTRLIIIENGLPGNFNVACSTLYGGHYAGLYRSSDAPWHTIEDQANLGCSSEAALKILQAAVCACGDEVQLQALESDQSGKSFQVVWEEEMGVEVVEVSLPTPHAESIFKTVTETGYQPLGKLICRPWEIPYDGSGNLPSNVLANQRLEIIVERSILNQCFIGLKLDVVVKRFDIGIHWIDRVNAAHPSFFVWLENESHNRKTFADPWARKEGSDTEQTYDEDGDNDKSDGQADEKEAGNNPKAETEAVASLEEA